MQQEKWILRERGEGGREGETEYCEEGKKTKESFQSKSVKCPTLDLANS